MTLLLCFKLNENIPFQGDTSEANRTIYCLQEKLSLECHNKNMLETKVCSLQKQVLDEMRWKEEATGDDTEKRKLKMASLKVTVIYECKI